MKEESLAIPYNKKKKYSSYAGEISPAPDNILKRDFYAEQPNEKWLTDLTEFHIPAGKVYLSPIIDCFDELPLCWSIGTSPNADLVNSMLDEAITTLKPGERPILHTDRGSHYRWPGWIERIANARLMRSMSQKANCADNAACEGFFGRLKNEFFYGRIWKNVSIEDFIKQLDEYLGLAVRISFLANTLICARSCTLKSRIKNELKESEACDPDSSLGIAA